MRVPSVLLLDNGELESTREVLDGLNVDVVCERVRTVKAWSAAKHDLLITTARCALASENVFQSTPRNERPVWIAFHNQDFLPLRERLRNIGVDYLVHNMIETELLRLLFLRVLFRDDERREARRLPAGASATCRLGGRHLAVTLAEIGQGGCLLLSPEPTELNAPLMLELPRELGDSANVHRIPGRVIRSERIAREPESALWKLAVEFDRSAGSPAPSLERLETGRAIGARVTCFEDARVGLPGPATRPTAKAIESPSPATSEAVGSLDPPESKIAPSLEGLSQREAALDWDDTLDLQEVPKDRRDDPRASIAGTKIRLLDEETGIVFGRDLSRRGVRIESHTGIAVGATLSLAIPGLSREEPLLLRAVVARNDGPDGLAVLFYDPDPDDLDRLDRIVASMPPIETLSDDPLAPERLMVVDWPSRTDS